MSLLGFEKEHCAAKGTLWNNLSALLDCPSPTPRSVSFAGEGGNSLCNSPYSKWDSSRAACRSSRKLSKTLNLSFLQQIHSAPIYQSAAYFARGRRVSGG